MNVSHSAQTRNMMSAARRRAQKLGVPEVDHGRSVFVWSYDHNKATHIFGPRDDLQRIVNALWTPDDKERLRSGLVVGPLDKVVNTVKILPQVENRPYRRALVDFYCEHIAPLVVARATVPLPHFIPGSDYLVRLLLEAPR